MIEPVAALLRDVAGTNASPVAAVTFGRLLRAAYSSGAAKFMVGFGILLGGGCVLLALMVDGDLTARLVLGIPAAALLALLLTTPAILALRARRALLYGTRVIAEVRTVEWSGPGDRATIDALSNGMARGRRTVLHPSGTFDQAFECDASWARELRPGSKMLALVHPTKAKVLFDLGRAELPG